MIYPNKIEKNDVIEIISPSNGVESKNIKKYERAIEKLTSFGFKIIEDEYVRNSENGVSSSANNRSIELNKAVKDKRVKAMIACSGGDFLVQILELINFNAIKDNIKWIQGQSDITPLLFYITTKYDIATIYGLNVKAFGDDYLPELVIKNNIDILKGKMFRQKEYGFKINDNTKRQSWECITEENSINGRIIGGCLDSLKDIIGTKYDCVKKFIKKYNSDGIVWYFDVAEMTNEDILRTMWQFKNAGWFEGCTGILFGRLENEISYTGISLKEAINYNLGELNVPILINTDIGHTALLLTIVNGAKVKITKNKIDNKYIFETFFM